MEYLEKQGLSYEDAVQRSYFAIDPDATRRAERLIKYETAVIEENNRGKFSSSSGQSKVVTDERGSTPIPDADREFMEKTKRIGTGKFAIELTPELYQKHQDYLERYKDL